MKRKLGPNLGRDIPLALLLACLPGVSPSVAQVRGKSETPTTAPITPDILPHSLSGVSLNMPLKAFLKTHPTIKRLAFLDDSDKVDENLPNQMLYDKINGDPFFTDIFYQFKSNNLVFVGATSLVQADALGTERQAFLTYLIGKYGAPSSYAVVEQNIKKNAWQAPRFFGGGATL